MILLITGPRKALWEPLLWIKKRLLVWFVWELTFSAMWSKYRISSTEGLLDTGRILTTLGVKWKTIYHCSQKKWKQAKCSPTNEWIKQMWYLPMVECYSPIKGMTYWYTLNIGEPREQYTDWKNQTQKATHCVIPFVWNIQNRKIYRDRV